MAQPIDYTRRLHENVNSWYTSADNKAQILLTLNGVFWGFLTSTLFMEPCRLQKIASYFGFETFVYLGLMTFSIGASMFGALMCLRSRLPKISKAVEPSPGTMWFFGYIRCLKRKTLSEALSSVDDDYEREALAADLGKLSSNVWAKHKWVNRGFVWLVTSLFCFMLMSVSYFVRLHCRPLEFYSIPLMLTGALIPLIATLLFFGLKSSEDTSNRATQSE